jgi:hypothetical protein
MEIDIIRKRMEAVPDFARRLKRNRPAEDFEDV